MSRKKYFQQPSNGRVRHVSQVMNGLEKKYSAHLDIRVAVKEIASYKFESIKLRLSGATFFFPDFSVVMPDGTVQLHEVKGHFEDDARVKIKVAASMFPEFKMIAATWDKRNKFWKFEEFI